MKTISAREVQKRLKKGEILNIIDVREAYEFQEGHIPGAMNIPLSLLEFRVHELDKKEPYIFLCHSGARSSLAVQYLESLGLDVTNMEGGMLAWEGEMEQSSCQQ